MLTSHELLLKFRYDARFTFERIRVCYVDRGAPSDCSCADGPDITSLESYYFEVASATGAKYIPYHRLRLIKYAGVTVWEKETAHSGKNLPGKTP